MKKSEIIDIVIPKQKRMIKNSSVTAFAPSNIALCKYWGKRDQELNLPKNSSLSISLGKRGAQTKLAVQRKLPDQVTLNNEKLVENSEFVIRIKEFLNLFRFQDDIYFHIDINMNLPIAAGLASSACGFASLILALNELYHWQLSQKNLSILARLGSGSACRSLWDGFVEWYAGKEVDGMDSFAEPLELQWPELRIGLLILNSQQKKLSSRHAMQTTVETAEFYQAWLTKAKNDLNLIKDAIQDKDFLKLGKISESNALAMHATMLTAWPPISFTLPETASTIDKIWQLRNQGLNIFFTQDAGPNLKLLFLEKDASDVKKFFPHVEIIAPFGIPI